jgi:hypothetical protein
MGNTNQRLIITAAATREKVRTKKIKKVPTRFCGFEIKRGTEETAEDSIE